MSKKLCAISSKFFLVLILTFILFFSLIAPTFVSAAVYDAVNEATYGIKGEVIDFSNLTQFNFSSKDSYNGEDAFGGSYEIVKKNSDYTITLNGLTAKKIILPYDDADNGKPIYQKGIPRKTHITIVLNGANNVTGYGEGSLNISAYKEIVKERFLDMADLTPEQRATEKFEPTDDMYKEKDEPTSYIVSGIVLETDAISDADSKSGFIIEATGQITINSPYYWGIICNGDIKFKSGSHVKITANPKNEKVAQSGAISADRIIKESNDALVVDSGKILESKKDETPVSKESSKLDPESTIGPVITGEGVVEGGTYCENPIITVTDDKKIVSVKVNKIEMTKFIYNSYAKKTFAIPTYMNDKKTIVATDSDGNKTTFEFNSHNGHICDNGTEISRYPATCTTDGYHELEYKCRICKKVLRTEKIIDKALGHSYSNWVTVSAVQDKRSCTRCGYAETKNTAVQIQNTSVSLSNSNFVYDGASKKPTVTVKNGNQTLVNGKDYTVQYSNNVNAGTATVSISGKAHYVGTVQKSFVIQKANNSITASNFTKNYSLKAQSFSIGAKQTGNAKLTYSSNNKDVTVDSTGKVTIKAGFAGKATITITANATSGYNKATKQITITMRKINNSITASNFTKNYSSRAQSFSIGARQAGNAKLTYSSNNKNVTVNSAGKVTIAKGFVGKAIITITANATSGYNKATKQITVIVNPPATAISVLTNTSGRKMTIKWNKNAVVTGYQIQYSTDKNFKKGVTTITINKNSTLSRVISNLAKNKIYYVRIRSYKTVSKVNYYSSWSVKSIRILK